MDRANDRVGRGVNEPGALNDMAARGASIAMAAGEEIESVGVTVEGAALDIVDILAGAESVPVNEVLFDSVAVCVAADGAKARAQYSRERAVIEARFRLERSSLPASGRWTSSASGVEAGRSIESELAVEAWCWSPVDSAE
jgi:hypothetical protein